MDKLLTEYAVIYTQLGEQAADEYFKQSKTLKELGITDEKEIQQRIKQVKDLFGNFLKMRSTSGLGSDETLRAKKLSFVGDRDLAFRGLVKTGRHSTQGRAVKEPNKERVSVGVKFLYPKLTKMISVIMLKVDINCIAVG